MKSPSNIDSSLSHSLHRINKTQNKCNPSHLVNNEIHYCALDIKSSKLSDPIIDNGLSNFVPTTDLPITQPAESSILSTKETSIADHVKISETKDELFSHQSSDENNTITDSFYSCNQIIPNKTMEEACLRIFAKGNVFESYSHLREHADSFSCY